MTDPLLELEFDFASMPAPRATRGSWWARGAKYVEWRKTVRMTTAIAARKSKLTLPFQFPVAISLEFCGINPRSDLDNHIKASLDALQGIVLDGDHSARVPAIAATCCNGGEPSFKISIYAYDEPRTWEGERVDVH